MNPTDQFPRIQRLPPYVFNIVNELKAQARKRGEDIIDFGMGNPDQPTPQHIVDKMIEAVGNSRNHRYSVSKGIPNLRLEIAKRYERNYGVQLDPDKEVIAKTVELVSKSNLESGGWNDIRQRRHPFNEFLALGRLRCHPCGVGEWERKAFAHIPQLVHWKSV
jgi:hypothetical protein